jgi:hypothetical protein
MTAHAYSSILYATIRHGDIALLQMLLAVEQEVSEKAREIIAEKGDEDDEG